MSNIPGSILRQSPSEHNWVLATPMDPETPIPCFDAKSDTGKFVKNILTRRDSLLGERVLGAAAYYTPNDMIAIFAELYPEAGKTARFVQLSKEAYTEALVLSGMPERVAEELYQNMMFMYEFGYYGEASLDDSLAVRLCLSQLPRCFGEEANHGRFWMRSRRRSRSSFPRPRPFKVFTKWWCRFQIEHDHARRMAAS